MRQAKVMSMHHIPLLPTVLKLYGIFCILFETEASQNFSSDAGTFLNSRRSLLLYSGPSSNCFVFNHSANYPSTGSTYASVFGIGFGKGDATPRMRFGSTRSENTLWSSDTNLHGMVASGTSVTLSVTVSIQTSINTITEALTIDAPVVNPGGNRTTWAVNHDIAVSSSMTIYGAYVAVKDSTTKARVGGTAFEVSRWISASSISTKRTSGRRSSISIRVTESRTTGTSTEIYSYDTADSSGVLWYIYVQFLKVVFVIGDSNLPPFPQYELNEGSIFVVGSHFSDVDFTSRAGIGHSAASATNWLSNTLIHCRASTGMFSSRTTVATAGDLHSGGTVSRSVSFDSPLMFRAIPSNIPKYGLSVVSDLQGVNLGRFDGSSKGFTSTSGEFTVWSSDTALQIKHSRENRAYVTLSVKVTLGIIVGTSSKIILYDNPSVSVIQPANYPPATSSVLCNSTGLCFNDTLLFGSYITTGLSSERGRIGSTACARTNWISFSSMSCRAVSGVSLWRGVQISVGTRVSTLTTVFTYDFPIISATTRQNAAGNQQVSVTVIGKNFGDRSDSSPKIRIGVTNSPLTKWVSDTSIQAKTAFSIYDRASVSLTLGRWCPLVQDVNGTLAPIVHDCFVTDVSTGSMTYSFTFDQISLLQLSTYKLADIFALRGEAGLELTIFANAFANYPASESSRIGGSSTEATFWVSSTILTCKSVAGIRGTRRLSVTSGMTPGCLSEAFTYLGPALFSSYIVTASITRGNGPTTGSVRFSLRGSLFGKSDYSAISSVGVSMCEMTKWISESTLLCQQASGTKRLFPLGITVGSRVSSVSNSWSFDAPQIQLGFTNSTDSSKALLVQGSDFASYDSTPRLRIGGSSCESSKWIASTSLLCNRPSGPGSASVAESLIVTEGLQKGTLSSYFTFEVHHISGSSYANGPSSGEFHCPTKILV
eukprot:766326-Hanusia_phi.AAC.5